MKTYVGNSKSLALLIVDIDNILLPLSNEIGMFLIYLCQLPENIYEYYVPGILIILACKILYCL